MTALPRLHVHLLGPAGGPLGQSFDDVVSRLTAIERIYYEPDGSLLWSGPRWQIGGMIYDRAEIVQYVELQGSIPREYWQRLIAAIAGADGQPTVLRLQDQSLHDLQSFENCTWA